MKKTIFCIFTAITLCALTAISCRAADQSAERKALNTDFDNSLSTAPERPEYDKIADNLRTTLQLDEKQERKLRAILRDSNRRYESLLASYNSANQRLQRERDEMMRLRGDIKTRLDSIPDVVNSLLELDQKEDYKKMLEEAKGAKEPIVAVSTATALVSPAPAPVRKAKKSALKKKKTGKKRAATHPAAAATPPVEAPPATQAAPDINIAPSEAAAKTGDVSGSPDTSDNAPSAASAPSPDEDSPSAGNDDSGDNGDNDNIANISQDDANDNSGADENTPDDNGGGTDDSGDNGADS